MRGANCSTDHIMIIAKTGLRARRPMRKSNRRPRKINVDKIKTETIRTDLEDSTRERLPTLSGSVEEKWSTFKSTLYEVSKDTFGYVRRKRADWLDENDAELNRLLESRNQARAEMLNSSTRSTKSKFRRWSWLLQMRCHALKNEWWQKKQLNCNSLQT